MTPMRRRHVAHHGQVVADEQVGEPQPLLQVAHQVQDLRLHRHVERAGRLVAHQELRVGGQARARCRCAGAGRRRTRADTWRRRPGRGRRGAAARHAVLGLAPSSLARPNALIGSATMRATRQRGLRLANGSWKIICRRWRNLCRSRRRAGAHMSMPSMVTLPAVGGRSPTVMRASVDLPEPDSPTSASVSPRPMLKETSVTARSSAAPLARQHALQPGLGHVEDAREAAGLDQRRRRSCVPPRPARP